MTEDQYLTVRHRTVRKANQLIQKSRFSLSLQQQKILLYIIAQISPQDEDFKLYQFSIPEFCRVCGLTDSGTNYSDLITALQNIRDKSIKATLPDGRITTLAWIEKPYIVPKSGVVQIRLDSDMKPFLLQLRENYTQYEMIFTLHFKSKYTIRLYELIKSIHFHDEAEYSRKFSVVELQTLLDADTYKQYRDFKRRVLIPCVDEINEYSDKSVTFEEVRQGRKVLAVEFTISSKDTLEVLRIKAEIDKEFGTDQLTLWDRIEQADEKKREGA